MSSEREERAWLERSRAAWDERAAQWDAMSEENAAKPGRPADIARTAAALGLRPGSRLLDAGCGTGQYAIAFAALGIEVVGVDLSPEMIARAEEHATAQGVTVTWRVGDLASLTDGDQAYDAVHARVSLQFAPDLVAAVEELGRVLRPGGRLYASVPGALSPIYQNSWRRFIEPAQQSANFVTPWELEVVLTHLGWRLLDGWGFFGAALSGDFALLRAEDATSLHPRLQQAAATTWSMVADRGTERTGG